MEEDTVEKTNQPKMTAAELLAAYSDPAPPEPPKLSPKQELLQACKMALSFFVQNGALATDLVCIKLIKLSEKAQTRRLVIVGTEAAKQLGLPKYAGKAATVEAFRLLCLDYLQKALTAVGGRVVGEMIFYEEKGEIDLGEVEVAADGHYRFVETQPTSEGVDPPRLRK